MVARWVHSLAACGLVLCLSGTAGAVPTLDRPVTDDAGVLKAPAVEAISKKLVLHYDKTGVQLAVLVIRTTNKRDIADYAQEVFDLWKGGDAGTDRGALFVLAMKDRRSRLHLGYGLEAIISDRGALGMLDRLKPTLRTGAVGTAVMQLVDDLIDRTVHLVRGEPVETPVGLRMGWGFFWSIFFVALLAGLLAGLVFSVKTTDKLTLKEMKKTTPGEALHVRSRWWRTHLVWDPETGRHHSGVAWLNIIVVLFGFVVAPAWAALFVTVGGFMEPVMGTWWFVLV
ncbi:MAG: TPM domain-containing protein, partial [Myxococcota bacterium]|nr:TPM domain-containing protein [Myxococcota bacterium]